MCISLIKAFRYWALSTPSSRRMQQYLSYFASLLHMSLGRLWLVRSANLRVRLHTDSCVAIIPRARYFRWLNPGPFNVKYVTTQSGVALSGSSANREHAFIVIMSSTASSVAIGMEIIAALGAST